ncbi:hypothetical protein XH94_23070 [Bradyrhizobium zhanjiangense]|uniref:Uncharacterized protein n=2 Tax=Bradyrhizobium zhanjiangense TaxID=1325107 RepID=A0A4Q0SFK7_9BRAD|nr:hypothetical protein XH94_23070 [Bradyrhizobium zhanjiangense]
MEPRRLDHAIAQHSALQQASRPEEIRGLRDDQLAPSAFDQGRVEFDPEQISQEELRQVLDNQSIPPPVSVSSEELQRLENDVHDELDVRRDDHPAQSFSVDPEEFTFNLDQFSPGELSRLLDDDSAQLAELQERQNDQPAPSAFVQEHVAFDPELRRVLDHLDHQPILSPVSVPLEELQRLEKDLQDELHGRRDDHAAPSFSADPEELTFNLEQFSPGELRRLLDDPSILSPLAVDPEDSALNSGQSPPPNELWRLLNDEPGGGGI